MSTCGGRSSPAESVWAAQMSELRSPQQPTLTGSRSWALIPDSMSSESCEHAPQHQPAFCCHFFQNTEWSSGWREHVIQSRVCHTPQSNRLAESLRLWCEHCEAPRQWEQVSCRYSSWIRIRLVRSFHDCLLMRMGCCASAHLFSLIQSCGNRRIFTGRDVTLLDENSQPATWSI